CHCLRDKVGEARRAPRVAGADLLRRAATGARILSPDSMSKRDARGQVRARAVGLSIVLRRAKACRIRPEGFRVIDGWQLLDMQDEGNRIRPTFRCESIVSIASNSSRWRTHLPQQQQRAVKSVSLPGACRST